MVTESERLARLHKRAGCDCEEDAEVEPTRLIEDVRKVHVEADGPYGELLCLSCGKLWPCMTIRLAKALEEALLGESIRCDRIEVLQMEINGDTGYIDQIEELVAQRERSRQLATKRGQLISECARMIPIARPLPGRIQFLIEENARLRAELEEKANDENRDR